MRYFHHVAQNVLNPPLIASVMRNQDALFPEHELATLRNGRDLEAMALVPDAKKMALGIMQMLNGTALGAIGIARCPHGAKLSLGGFLYVIHVSDGVEMLVGDEMVPLRVGDVWWTKETGIIINKSQDDAIIMSMDITIDE
jgi:hypothetical protein